MQNVPLPKMSTFHAALVIPMYGTSFLFLCHVANLLFSCFYFQDPAPSLGFYTDFWIVNLTLYSAIVTELQSCVVKINDSISFALLL